MVRFSTRMNLLKGSAIRELLALANKPEILSFAGGMPAPELFPVDKIKAATDAVLEEQGKIALQYSSTNGFEHFRQQIADRMEAKLNIKTPDTVQPATGCIDEYIKIVSKLMDTGYAYFAGGNVYFDTSKLERYYIFNDHNEEDLAVGVREGVEEDTNKRNKNDFVLWFTKSKFEDQALKWDSPWGVGYPGWHIECSGISMKYNGEYLDLHCGGIDNAFPHHTNEIAQSESYLGHPWCPQWFHVAHLNTSHGKMSKSKGEFLTVSLLEEKGYDPLSYRFFCLQSHYRKALVFTWENLDNATVAYNKLLTRIAALKDEGEVDQAAFDEYKAKFTAAMDNDLCREVLEARTYETLPTTDHPEGQILSNWFLRRIEDKDTHGEILGAKTGYVVQSGNCAVSFSRADSGRQYICVTADAHSAWRCIYDHVAVYQNYTE